MDNSTINPAWQKGVVSFSSRYLPEWQQELIRKFPDIYKTPNPKIIEVYKEQKCEKNLDTEFFCNLRFGFEFSQGWKDLVYDFSEKTSEFIYELRAHGIQKDAYVRSFIFKEKFGRLTWQGDDNLQEPFKTIFQGYISAVEQASTWTCERTGKHGSLRNIAGYYVTLCSEEYEKECVLRKDEIENFEKYQMSKKIIKELHSEEV